MSSLTNIFSIIDQVAGNTIGNKALFETRIENNANGDPIYIGYSPLPAADTAEAVWLIIKLHYDGNNNITRVEQLENRIFGYVWDDRASYF